MLRNVQAFTFWDEKFEARKKMNAEADFEIIMNIYKFSLKTISKKCYFGVWRVGGGCGGGWSRAKLQMLN